MKFQFLLVSVVSAGLFVLTPGSMAQGVSNGAGHGGGSSAGHGGSWSGRGGVSGGHSHGAWAGQRGGLSAGQRSAWANRGGAWGGHGRGAWAGRNRGTWRNNGQVVWSGNRNGFHHGRRFVNSGFAYYGFGYPWWWNYPYYPYYGDPYYSDAYYGDQYYQNNDPRIPAIVAAQTALAQRGYYQGPIDGVLGPQTRNAIRSFQAHEGLTVTGQVDDRLINALQG